MIIRPQCLILLVPLIIVGQNQGSDEILMDESLLICGSKQLIHFLASDELIQVYDHAFKIPSIDLQNLNTVIALSRVVDDKRVNAKNSGNEAWITVIKGLYNRQHVEMVELVAITTRHIIEENDDVNLANETYLMHIKMRLPRDDSSNIKARLMHLYTLYPDFFLNLSLFFLIVALAASTLYCTLEKHNCS